ncbi:MAG: IPT/TIG domain-containing protein [Acidimicrobiales bacterium]|jgi:hypothetical protein
MILNSDGGRSLPFARRRRAAAVVVTVALVALAPSSVLAAPLPRSPAAGSGGTITGRVLEAKIPALIGGVCVTAKGAGSGSALSAPDGTYSISDLGAGSYTVTADPTCGDSRSSIYLAAKRTSVKVTAGKTTRGVNLSLSPRKPEKVIGIVPPAVPSSNCESAEATAVADIDQCRALEGVGPLVLPSNYAKLTGPEQMLVVFNIERVNRGLEPIAGLNASLDADALTGAENGTDPLGPDGFGWGSIWAGGYGSIEYSDWAWLYDDGYPGPNGDCTSVGESGCWGHRDITLSASSGSIVGGGGVVTGSHAAYGYSAAFLFVFGYPTRHLVFSWAGELKYFREHPALEPLAAPTVVRLSPGHGAVAGGTSMTISGTSLWGVSVIDFGPDNPARDVSCDGDSCTMRTPAGKAGKVYVRVTTPSGTSAARASDEFSYIHN